MSSLDSLNLSVPIFQAPMAGVATPALAAAVSEAGGLGAIGLGASDADAARAMIRDTTARTNRAFNVNLFVHADPVEDTEREAAWHEALAPAFAEANAAPPREVRTIYQSFASDDAMLAVLVEERPAVVSFHFGLPDADRMAALREAGCLLIASVTNGQEADAAQRAGIDAIVAQGIEAGGHRGMFDPAAPDDELTTFALTRLLVKRCSVPVIAAGGIMDGAGIAAALDLGAAAAQLGTAFVACPESNADAGYRAALESEAAAHTVMTRAISGRPARSLANRFTRLGQSLSATPPAYPRAYDSGKALNAAHKAIGEAGFGAHWAGQGAPMIRPMPAAELMAVLRDELAAAR